MNPPVMPEACFQLDPEAEAQPRLSGLCRTDTARGRSRLCAIALQARSLGRDDGWKDRLLGLTRAMRATTLFAAKVLMLGLGQLAALEVLAQPAPPQIPDAVVRQMLELGLQNIQRALCQGLDTCAPATPEEFANPPISMQHARVAVMTGTRTALAVWCGLDADRRSVAPMTRQLRQAFRFNERQVALMAVIHSIQQSIVAEQLKKGGACDEATRSQLDAQLPKT